MKVKLTEKLTALLSYSLPHLTEQNLVKYHEKLYYMTGILDLGLSNWKNMGFCSLICSSKEPVVFLAPRVF